MGAVTSAGAQELGRWERRGAGGRKDKRRGGENGEKGRGERIRIIQKSLDTGLTRCHQNLASLLIHLCKFHSLATQAAPACGFYSRTKRDSSNPSRGLGSHSNWLSGHMPAYCNQSLGQEMSKSDWLGSVLYPSPPGLEEEETSQKKEKSFRFRAG